MTETRITRFLDRIAAVDGSEPLSDAKLDQIDNNRQTLVVEEGDNIVAVAVVAQHEHADGSFHWAAESALEPGLRFAAFEERLLASTIALVPRDAPTSVWSHRPSLDRALLSVGFVVSRELAHYTVSLPLNRSADALEIRSYRDDDADAVVELNRDAFETHREATGLDSGELGRLLRVEGMGPRGFLIAEDDFGLVGFCWTRVHPNGDGEIYRIAVGPRSQGRGIGRSLVLGGFAFLAGEPAVARGTLWVDLGNESAVALYRSLGMEQDRVTREYERDPSTGG